MRFKKSSSKSDKGKNSSVNVIPPRPEENAPRPDENEELPEDDEEQFRAETVKLVDRLNMKKKKCCSCQSLIPENAMRCFSCHVDQPVNPLGDETTAVVVRNNKNWKITQFSMESDDPDLPPFHNYSIKLKDRNLIGSLAGFVGLKRVNKRKKLKSVQRSTILARDLIMVMPRLRASLENYPPLFQQFVMEELEPIREQTVNQIKACLKKRKIPADALWYLFEPGTAIYGFDNLGNKIGSMVKTSNYSGFADCFNLTGSIIKTDGEKFFYADKTFSINSYSGFKDLDELSVRVLNKTTYNELTYRGKFFAKFSLGHHFMQYCGLIVRNVGIHTTKTRIKSRIMIDVKMYNRRHPSDCVYRSPNQSTMEGLSKEERWLAYPTLPGFSFSMKDWGEFFVKDIIPIEFDRTAFERLVLPEQKKTLIHALVEDYRKNVALHRAIEERAFQERENPNAILSQEDLSAFDQHGNSRLFTDLISGKGAGCIFLLHGSPGVGKTLTAEAVCEHLSIPLYMITVGELGTTPDSLERNLQEILELAASWGCGILLDEADIFLEKRSKKDIVRNAMVGIFLRLLEYHNGVLFLTTNRLSCIDEAFSSRISVALHYHELDYAARAQIWQTFLSASVLNEEALNGLDIPHLASFEMNGRQIRSVVRLSVAQARIDQSYLTMQHIMDTIRLSVDFKTQFFDERASRRARKQRTESIA